jgi:NADH:ubiquinone oxidoreductase subunit
MDRASPAAYISPMTIGTRLFTFFNGRLVGRDDGGNRYYRDRWARKGTRARRWVLYRGAPEASRVPPEWHAWLHYTTDDPLPAGQRRAWQRPHEENATGTPSGYRPPGHDYQGGVRAPATGDYEAWAPGN